MARMDIDGGRQSPFTDDNDYDTCETAWQPSQYRQTAYPLPVEPFAAPYPFPWPPSPFTPTRSAPLKPHVPGTDIKWPGARMGSVAPQPMALQRPTTPTGLYASRAPNSAAKKRLMQHAIGGVCDQVAKKPYCLPAQVEPREFFPVSGC
eukprot:GEMP01063140.1.p2 GENE.GEMP01063140.1~~GEMP01063140.1.p2  ORF type:complete len:149 (+),score=30.38 GEMP01063140.1:60-506(+)